MARTGWRAGNVARCQRGTTVTPAGRASRQVDTRVLKSPHTSQGVPSPLQQGPEPGQRRGPLVIAAGGQVRAADPDRRPGHVQPGQRHRPRFGRLGVDVTLGRVHPPLLHPQDRQPGQQRVPVPLGRRRPAVLQRGHEHPPVPQPLADLAQRSRLAPGRADLGQRDRVRPQVADQPFDGGLVRRPPVVLPGVDVPVQHAQPPVTVHLRRLTKRPAELGSGCQSSGSLT